MRLFQIGFPLLAIAFAMAVCLPATSSAQEPNDICGEHVENMDANRLESVMCRLSKAVEDQPFEAYAIKRSHSLIGPLEHYVLLANIDGDWHLQAVGFLRDYDEPKLVRNVYTLSLDAVPAEDAAGMTSGFSDTAWAAIEGSLVIDADTLCVDGTALTAYRYDGSGLEQLGLHDCYGESGLTDLADQMARYAVSQDAGLEPYIDSLLN